MTGVNDNTWVADNIVQGFQLESSNLRGRVVRLGGVIDAILSAHRYPEAVQRLTGEMLTLAALLSSMLKYEGIFTLQAQGKGPVRMAVADMTSDGHVRACAAFKEEELKESDSLPAHLLGTGHMAFTVDQGDFTERYQGIVELDAESLIGSVQNYFTRSEQIATGIVMAVARVDNKWRGGAIILQQMPDETKAYNADREDIIDDDDWRRAMMLMRSVKDDELLSARIGAEDILYRLFHEEGVRIFPAKTLANVCRCSPDRVRRILITMGRDDIEDITVNGEIVMTCEFCSTDYIFKPEDFLIGDEQ